MANEEINATPSPDDVDDSFEDASDAETGRMSDISMKIQTLEQERIELVQENKQNKERLEKLYAEIGEWTTKEAVIKQKVCEMARKIDEGEESKHESDVIAARCAELETELAKMHRDLVLSRNEVNEGNAEVAKLKDAITDKGTLVQELEKEMEELKKSKGKCEMHVKELETKTGVLEVKEVEGKSMKLRIEEEMRDRIAEKEGEIQELKEKVEELEAVVLKTSADSVKRENDKSSLVAKLRESEGKTRTVEMKIVELQKVVEEAEKMISRIKDRILKGANGKFREWKAVVIGTAGAIAAAAAFVYVRHGRQK